ncbi:hypothetical protein SeMB42_g03264 [Synchytrium endobioticum]|uniref:Uncharacterized protein n=1 Tax=Synchytrium endobioticum TaxID=286115 RepID=A0A507D7X5_9FUNG|nr:hypothetical protein SeMB42_g03264 [Synchytrium endobioticum]
MIRLGAIYIPKRPMSASGGGRPAHAEYGQRPSKWQLWALDPEILPLGVITIATCIAFGWWAGRRYSSELRGGPMYQKTRAKLGLSEPEDKGKSW